MNTLRKTILNEAEEMYSNGADGVEIAEWIYREFLAPSEQQEDALMSFDTATKFVEDSRLIYPCQDGDLYSTDAYALIANIYGEFPALPKAYGEPRAGEHYWVRFKGEILWVPAIYDADECCPWQIVGSDDVFPHSDFAEIGGHIIVPEPPTKDAI